MAANLIAAVASTPGDRTAVWSHRTVSLTGTAPDDVERSGIARRVGTAVPGASVDNRLTIPAGVAVDRGALQRKINDLVAASPVTFLPNSPMLTSSGGATVRAAGDLLRGRNVRVDVNGYTASAGPSTLDAGQLSERRAETVRQELIKAGTAAERITARGFGDAKPLDPTNPAVNRRVEIVVV
jgi:OOP family OmpA-OmpF porin